jgi:hypothetical protein
MTTEKPDVIAASSFRDAQFEPRRTSRLIADALRAAIIERLLLPTPSNRLASAEAKRTRAVSIEARRQMAEQWDAL